MRALLFLLFCVFVSTASAVPAALRSVRHAQALLGPETWTQVVRVHNENARSPYPRTVYALIFEFAGILWFYTDADGTQSFSLYQNRTEHEKQDLAPGLRAIEPGFTRFQVITEPWIHAPSGILPNGCFIDSVVAARDLLSTRSDLTAAQLLLVYPKDIRAGHCYLIYEAAGRRYAVDPLEAGSHVPLAGGWGDDAMELARKVWPEGASGIRTARTLGFPIHSSKERKPLWVTSEPADAVFDPGRS